MARLACYDSLADAAPAQRSPVAAVATATPTAVAATKPSDNFGLPQRVTEPQEVHSSVGASFGGWGPNSRIRLDNGQVWLVIDGSSVIVPERARKVAVKRGALGSFYLDFQDLKTSPRVRRVE